MELSHLNNIPHSSRLWDLLVSRGAHVDPTDPSPRASRQTPLITAIQAANSNGDEASASLLFGLPVAIVRRYRQQRQQRFGWEGHNSRGFLSSNAGNQKLQEQQGEKDPSQAPPPLPQPFTQQWLEASCANAAITDDRGALRWSSFTNGTTATANGMAGGDRGERRIVQRYHCLLAAGASVNSFTPESVDDPDSDEGLKFRTSALVSKNPLAQCVYISNHRLTDLRPAYIRSMLETARDRQREQQEQQQQQQQNELQFGYRWNGGGENDMNVNPLLQQQQQQSHSVVNVDQLDHPSDDYDRTAAAKALLDCGADPSSVLLLCGGDARLEKVTSESLRQLLLAEGIAHAF